MAENILIYAPNWLGDSVMSMPAVQAFRRHHSDCRLTILCRSALAPLWRMHRAVDEVVEFSGGLADTLRVVRWLKIENHDKAFIFPNSFRSALIPTLAGIPARIGARGHMREWLLTSVVPPPSGDHQAHQAWEYLAIVGLSDKEVQLDPPRIEVSDAMVAQSRERLSSVETHGGWIGLIPGAARGPSKRWPATHYADLGRRLIKALRCRILVFGTAEELQLCAQVTGAIGGGATNLAGATSLRELAALLRMCRLVVANDSGGMHLAVAVGARVVAVFGATDPAKTGPVGAGHAVVAPENVKVSHKIKPRSREAERLLYQISPGRVAQVVLDLLTER